MMMIPPSHSSPSSFKSPHPQNSPNSSVGPQFPYLPPAAHGLPCYSYEDPASYDAHTRHDENISWRSSIEEYGDQPLSLKKEKDFTDDYAGCKDDEQSFYDSKIRNYKIEEEALDMRRSPKMGIASSSMKYVCENSFHSSNPMSSCEENSKPRLCSPMQNCSASNQESALEFNRELPMKCCIKSETELGANKSDELENSYSSALCLSEKQTQIDNKIECDIKDKKENYNCVW